MDTKLTFAHQYVVVDHDLSDKIAVLTNDPSDIVNGHFGNSAVIEEMSMGSYLKALETKKQAYLDSATPRTDDGHIWLQKVKNTEELINALKNLFGIEEETQYVINVRTD